MFLSCGCEASAWTPCRLVDLLMSFLGFHGCATCLHLLGQSMEASIKPTGQEDGGIGTRLMPEEHGSRYQKKMDAQRTSEGVPTLLQWLRPLHCRKCASTSSES